mmetsp:Transcript_12095/g.30522  ORF Transcript_12095/g.30522 Transcript_12095/m.30522 type:complete len:92 (-) Transcript_12095:87-362(-)
MERWKWREDSGVLARWEAEHVEEGLLPDKDRGRAQLRDSFFCALACENRDEAFKGGRRHIQPGARRIKRSQFCTVAENETPARSCIFLTAR